MQSLRPPTPEQSSRSASSVERSAVSAPHGEPRTRTIASAWRYEVPREWRFSWFLILSTGLFALATCLAALIPPEEKLPPMIQVDLGFDGVENEPPPLGEPDAGMGEVQPEPPAPEPQAEPMPEQKMEPVAPEPVTQPEPEPVPEPEPEMKQEPVPEPTPQFEVPKEEQPPAPKPEPKPVEKPKPKPKQQQPQQKPAASAQPATTAPTQGGPVGSGLTTGRAGVRGSPGGKPGGRGGGRGDFVSTPHPQYDSTAKQRGYQGRGIFVIQYENGRIVSVSAQQSTGVPYLDARTIAWIKSRWRVKSGTSGAASLPITWQLR